MSTALNAYIRGKEILNQWCKLEIHEVNKIKSKLSPE